MNETIPDDIMKAAREAVTRSDHYGPIIAGKLDNLPEVQAIARAIAADRKLTRNATLEEAAGLCVERAEYWRNEQKGSDWHLLFAASETEAVNLSNAIRAKVTT